MKNSNNKIYITLLIFALVSLFLVIFGVWPLLEDIEKNSKELISAKNSIVVLNSEIDEIENFKSNYNIFKSNLEKIDQSFIDINYPVDFIKFLEDTASDCGVDLEINLPSSDQQVNTYLMLQLSSEGTFSGILDFTKKIESGPYLIEIDNLTIQNSQVKGEMATFNIKAFTKNETITQ